ncbi:hypothetical protein OZX73_01235 [Bifidobacterium sp. ESL0775]|nr:hypothetical protein [Bifidobacterium sp. ESL0775]WEV69546.1 hypothetical protein OZX73_01235 [Bifidobacterium sp. ESL0775]
MMMIVLCHFFYYNKFSLDQQPMGLKRIVLKTFFGSQGRVGVDIFFAISVWFLCKPNRRIRFHDSARRAWILERTLLFWSLILTIACAYTRMVPVTLQTVLNAIFPTATCDWGYATSYIIILLLLPFINQGISCLNQRQHFYLCVILLFFGPILGVIPGFYHQMVESGPLAFLCLMVFVTYLRWYHEQFPNILTGLACLVVGYAIVGLEAHAGFQIYEMMDLGILVETFGWFTLASHLHFSSRFINWIASHVFAIYLITEFIPIRNWLWGTIFDYGPYYHGLMSMIYPITVTLFISIICILLDIMKSAIFKLTIDHRKGHWFELLWTKIYKASETSNTAQSRKQNLG